MKIIDPGHVYQLDILDAEFPVKWFLTFVKREGEKYPGNVGHYPGTTLQEVLRACIDRVKYLDNQIPCSQNERVIAALRHAIFLLEERAAIRHQRVPLHGSFEIELLSTCPKCLHIGCGGECHP